jgi:hypothetical protein
VIRGRWFLIPVVLVSAGIGIALAVGGREDRPPSVEELRDFDGFALFYAGDSVDGHALESAQAVPLGASFVYGTCEPPPVLEGSCAPPVQIQLIPACLTRLALPPERTSVRSVPGSLGGHRLELLSGDARIAIYAEHPLAVARALRGINNGVLPGEPLPAPSDETLACAS